MHYTVHHVAKPKTLFKAMQKDRDEQLARQANRVNNCIDSAGRQYDEAKKNMKAAKKQMKQISKALKKFAKTGDVKHLATFEDVPF